VSEDDDGQGHDPPGVHDTVTVGRCFVDGLVDLAKVADGTHGSTLGGAETTIRRHRLAGCSLLAL